MKHDIKWIYKKTVLLSKTSVKRYGREKVLNNRGFLPIRERKRKFDSREREIFSYCGFKSSYNWKRRTEFLQCHQNQVFYKIYSYLGYGPIVLFVTHDLCNQILFLDHFDALCRLNESILQYNQFGLYGHILRLGVCHSTLYTQRSHIQSLQSEQQRFYLYGIYY